jgi:hypothetical protein
LLFARDFACLQISENGAKTASNFKHQYLDNDCTHHPDLYCIVFASPRSRSSATVQPFALR